MVEPDDYGDLWRDDVRRVREVAGGGGGVDTSLPAMVEGGFGALTALVGLVWFLMLFWVPDPISGGAWMGFGMLGLVLFGAPTGAIYALRRGGAEVVREVARSVGGGE